MKKTPLNILHGTTAAAIFTCTAFAPSSSEAAVVSTLDAGGDVDITNELGNFTSTAMQALITGTGDLTMAGILDAEGTFSAVDFSNDTGALSDKITGATRYGRNDGIASKASGSRWGFVSGNETWTPDAGLTHFGLITTATAASNQLSVTVTYSDATTDTATGVIGETNWIGFHKSGQTITSILMDDAAGGAFDNYDDVSLVFVPEPSSTSLLGLAALGCCLRRRRG
ncbi:MAG: PEP-CTERM sorting domain-containing protein [Akkermansiaceae bacterium]